MGDAAQIPTKRNLRAFFMSSAPARIVDPEASNFPFDKIQIDKSFTRDCLNRRDCKAVVSSVLALARGLGIVTTAQGVDSAEQFEYLRTAGADLVQGYLFGKPTPIAELGLRVATAPRVKVA